MLLYLNGRKTRRSLNVRRIENLKNTDLPSVNIWSIRRWETYSILLQRDLDVVGQYSKEIYDPEERFLVHTIISLPTLQLL